MWEFLCLLCILICYGSIPCKLHIPFKYYFAFYSIFLFKKYLHFPWSSSSFLRNAQ